MIPQDLFNDFDILFWWEMSSDIWRSLVTILILPNHWSFLLFMTKERAEHLDLVKMIILNVLIGPWRGLDTPLKMLITQWIKKNESWKVEGWMCGWIEIQRSRFRMNLWWKCANINSRYLQNRRVVLRIYFDE